MTFRLAGRSIGSRVLCRAFFAALAWTFCSVAGAQSGLAVTECRHWFANRLAVDPAAHGYSTAQEIRSTVFGPGSSNPMADARTAKISAEHAARTAALSLEVSAELAWSAIQAGRTEFDAIFIGLGPNGASAYAAFVDAFVAQHGRLPRALAVGDSIGGAFGPDSAFFLNTGYVGRETDPSGNGSPELDFGFSPHPGFAIDPLEVATGMRVFEPGAIAWSSAWMRGPNDRASLALGRGSALIHAQANGSISALFPLGSRSAADTEAQAQAHIRRPDLRDAGFVTIAFTRGRAIHQAVAIELARLGTPSLTRTRATVLRADSTGVLIELQRGDQTAVVRARTAASMEGPGDERPLFTNIAGSAPADASERVLSTTEFERLIGSRGLGTVASEWRGSSVLFVGNGDSSLAAIERALNLGPIVRDGEAFPEDIARGLRERFVASSLSIDTIFGIQAGQPRLGVSGRPTASRSPFQPDRYARVLAWLSTRSDQLIEPHVVSAAWTRRRVGFSPARFARRLRVEFSNGRSVEVDRIVYGIGRGDPDRSPIRGLEENWIRLESDGLAIGMQAARTPLFVGGYNSLFTPQVAADGNIAQPVIGPISSVRVANPTSMPTNLPRARELGRRMAERLR